MRWAAGWRVRVRRGGAPLVGLVDALREGAGVVDTWAAPTKTSSQNLAKIDPPEGFMGSKSAQNLMLMPNLLSDYVGYNVNLYILVVFWVHFVSIFRQAVSLSARRFVDLVEGWA